MSLSLSDIETISNVAMKMDANPVVLIGRFLGLSAGEQAAGVPKWGWAALAIGAAAAGGLLLKKHFSKNGRSKTKRKTGKKRVIRSKMFRPVGKKRMVDTDSDDSET